MNPDPSLAASAGRCCSLLEAFSREHRTGLLTLVFTDVVDSTALKQQRGEHLAVALIQRHHAILRELMGLFPDAREIETAGDSFLLVFSRPSEAVRFSLQLHARLAVLAQQTGQPVLDRIGIHVGEVFVRGQEGSAKLFGSQVDLCARVMSLAGANQVLMTRFAFDNARRMVRAEEVGGVGPLNWLNHGLYRLRGVEEPVEVCEVRVGAPGPVTPPTSSEKAQRLAGEEELVLGWRPAVGQTVPNTKWVLEEKLGEGGFGEVWKARHEKLAECRVFKFCFRADRVRSLKREVTLFRLLKERIGEHPNIVKLHDIFFDEPPYYLEEEFVAGKDLRTWCEGRRSVERGGVAGLPLGVKLEIVAQAAEGLQAAHDAGVIHRDIKPGNILVQSRSRRKEALTSAPEDNFGESEPPHVGSYEVLVKLTDFGIGQVVSEEVLGGLTRAGFTQTLLSPSSSYAGTHLYMAPELLAGTPASTRSDIYSLGVVLFQLLVGDFARPVTTDWADQVCDPLLREDLKQCFAGDVQKRFVSAADLAQRLRSYDQRQVALIEQCNAVLALAELRAALAATKKKAVILFAARGVVVLTATIVLLAYLGGMYRTLVGQEWLRTELDQYRLREKPLSDLLVQSGNVAEALERIDKEIRPSSNYWHAMAVLLEKAGQSNAAYLAHSKARDMPTRDAEPDILVRPLAEP